MQQSLSQPATHVAALDGITRPAAPPIAYRRPERRNLAKRYALVQRVQREFDEMPGTSLTLQQATRLFGIAPDICQRILQELVTEGALRQGADLKYRLRPSA